MADVRARQARVASIWLLAAVMLCACAGPQPSASTSSGNAPATAAPKRVTLAMAGDPPGFYSQILDGIPGSDGLQDLVFVGLLTLGNEGGLRSVLAEAVPTIENGQWKLFPDGRMETTWTLRPNAHWHDGVAVTPDDLIFSIKVHTDKELPAFRDPSLEFLDHLEARDARTVVAYWKQPFISADLLFSTTGTGTIGGSQPLPLPKHLLEGPYNENKSNFTRLPYWNQEFVGTGPFKLRELVPSSHVLVTANDQYVLGRPKIDEVEVKIIQDSNAILVNVLSGVVDLTLGRTVSLEQGIEAQERGAVKADAAPFNLQRIWPQFIDPRPAVIGDARFRRALLYALNRQELVDTLEAGWTTVPASILPPNQAQYRTVEATLPQYPYDPQRTAQIIQELGYSKGPDGGFSDASGEKLAVDIRNTAGDDNQTKVLFSIKNYWERVGVAVEITQLSRAQNQDREYKANRPGFQYSGGPNGLSALGTLASGEIPRPETNFSGANTARYSSSEYDALYQRFLITIPQADRTQVLAQLLQHLMTNLPIMPLYYRTEARLVANRLRNVAPRNLESSPAWDVHQWDVD